MPDGQRHARSATETPVAAGPDAIVDACIGILRKVRRAASGLGEVNGIGIASPGPVDPHRGIVLEPPNLGDAFRDIALAERVQQALGSPAYLDRDTNVAALGERAFGAGRDCDDFVYLTVSTGIGGGIVTGGRLLHGPDGLAGELGHVPVGLYEPLCGCGGRGHLEAVASGRALARDARAAAAAGDSPYLVTRAAVVGPDRLSARDVAEGEATNDLACTMLMDRARRAVAVACVGFVNTFNPHRIIIGGTIASAQGERMLQPVRAAIAIEAFDSAARRVTVLGPELGPDVSLAGAYPLVQERRSTASGSQPATAERLAQVDPMPMSVPSP